MESTTTQGRQALGLSVSCAIRAGIFRVTIRAQWISIHWTILRESERPATMKRDVNSRFGSPTHSLETAIVECLDEIAISHKPARSLIAWAASLTRRGYSDAEIATFLIETASALRALGHPARSRSR
jgi:hypothetical protein